MSVIGSRPEEPLTGTPASLASREAAVPEAVPASSDEVEKRRLRRHDSRGAKSDVSVPRIGSSEAMEKSRECFRWDASSRGGPLRDTSIERPQPGALSDGISAHGWRV
jgi:hypothetical protein